MRYQRSSYQNVMRSNRYRPILVIVLVLVAAFLILRFAGVGGLDLDSVVLAEQLRTIDKRRLRERLGVLPEPENNLVDQAVKISLGLLRI